jgi:hypothetical protein
LSKAISSIGGFISLCLLFYGMLTAYCLPKILMNEFSGQMINNKNKLIEDILIKFEEAKN